MSKQIVIHDCMPAMADVISGSVPRPADLPEGLQVDDKVGTVAGYVPWCDVAPAWRVLGLPRASAVCYVAQRGRDPQDVLCQAIYAQAGELRAALGENGAVICAGGRLVAFNSDGTRAATVGDVEG